MCWHAKGCWERDLDATEQTARAHARSGRPVAAGVVSGGGGWAGGPPAAPDPEPDAVPDPDLLIADPDRERVVDALKQATADGRLTIDEFSERVEEAYRARTAADLRHVVRQLPAAIRAAAEPPRPPSMSRSPSTAGGAGHPARGARRGFHPVLLTAMVIFGVLLLTGGRVFVVWPALWLLFVFRHRWGWRRY